MTYNKRGIFIRILYLIVSIIFYFLQRIKKTYYKNNFLITLCYHGVRDKESFYFQRQLNLIKKYNFSFQENAFKTNLDYRKIHISITFDDAFENLIRNVIPYVQEFSTIPIIIFVPTGCLGDLPRWLRNTKHIDRNEPIMSAKDISFFKNNPVISFGSHTIDHQPLSSLPQDELIYQLRESKKALFDLTGKEVNALALPHGDYNPLVLQIAIEEGYQYIYTLESSVSPIISKTLPRIIGRFSVSPDDWPIEFFLTIRGAYAWLNPFRSYIRRFRQ